MKISPRIRTILLGSLFLIVVVTIGYLLYSVFFRPTTPTVEVPETDIGEISPLPTIDESGAVVPGQEGEEDTPNEGLSGIPGVDTVAQGGLTQTQVITPQVNAEDPQLIGDSLNYYNPEDGKFYAVDNAGNSTAISGLQYAGVEQVTWADSGDQAILEFPDGANVYVDLQSGEQVTLPAEYEEFDFSPSSDTIAFKYLTDNYEQNVLAISNPDGSNARTIESLGRNEDRVDVEWSPTGRVIATYDEFIDGARQEIGFVGLNNENFKGVVVQGYGLEKEYSPDGQQLLYSTYSEASEYKPELAIVDSNGADIGKNRRDIGINTFAHKCAFAQDQSALYCGVPKDQEYGYGLEPSLLADTTDDIYQIDLQTGSKRRIAVPVNENGQPDYSVEKMFTSSDGDYLYFRDEQTGQLVKINL